MHTQTLSQLLDRTIGRTDDLQMCIQCPCGRPWALGGSSQCWEGLREKNKKGSTTTRSRSDATPTLQFAGQRCGSAVPACTKVEKILLSTSRLSTLSFLRILVCDHQSNQTNDRPVRRMMMYRNINFVRRSTEHA